MLESWSSGDLKLTGYKTWESGTGYDRNIKLNAGCAEAQVSDVEIQDLISFLTALRTLPY